MKNIIRKLTLTVLSLFVFGVLFTCPVSAETSFRKTGNQQKDIVSYAMSRVGQKDERGKMCAGFVVSSAKAAGMTSSQIDMNATIASPFKGTNQFGFLGTDGSTKYNCKAYTWKDFVNGTYTPKAGDLVFYGYFKDYSRGTQSLTISQAAKKNYYHVHVGIIRSDSCTLEKIYTVDGGQSGSDGKSTWVKTKTRTTAAASGAVSGWKSSGKQVYVLEFIRPDYSDSSNDYIAKCEKTETYLELRASNSTDAIKTHPCSSATYAQSRTVRKLVSGETLTATAIYKNTAGNYWYKVKASDGMTGYIYGGTAAVTGIPSDALTGNAKLSTTAPPYGRPLDIKGTLESKMLTIYKVKGVLAGRTGSPQTKTITVNKRTLDIKSSDINTCLKFGKLPKGAGTLQLTVTLRGKATNGKTLSTAEFTKQLKVISFTVK